MKLRIAVLQILGPQTDPFKFMRELLSMTRPDHNTPRLFDQFITPHTFEPDPDQPMLCAHCHWISERHIANLMLDELLEWYETYRKKSKTTNLICLALIASSHLKIRTLFTFEWSWFSFDPITCNTTRVILL